MATIRRKRRNGLKIRKDIKGAQKTIDKFGLVPTLDRVDAGRSSEISSLIDSRQDEYDRSLARDPEQESLLNLLKGGLGGLTAQENTAFRERGEAGLDRTYAQGARSLASTIGSRGVRGAAATAGLRDLNFDRGAAQGDLERDLQIANIQLQDQRRNDFSGFLDSLITGESDRRGAALSGLESTTASARQDELGRDLINMDAQRREEALKNSTLFGLVGLKGVRRSGKDALALEKERLALDKSIAEQQSREFAALLGSLGGE